MCVYIYIYIYMYVYIYIYIYIRHLGLEQQTDIGGTWTLLFNMFMISLCPFIV